MLENLKKLEAEGKVGASDYFKPQSGNNIIRILTEGIHNVNKFGNGRAGSSKTSTNTRVGAIGP